MDYEYHSSKQLKRIADYYTRNIKKQNKTMAIVKRVLLWVVIVFLVLVILATYRMEGRL